MKKIFLLIMLVLNFPLIGHAEIVNEDYPAFRLLNLIKQQKKIEFTNAQCLLSFEYKIKDAREIFVAYLWNKVEARGGYVTLNDQNPYSAIKIRKNKLKMTDQDVPLNHKSISIKVNDNGLPNEASILSYGLGTIMVKPNFDTFKCYF